MAKGEEPAKEIGDDEAKKILRTKLFNELTKSGDDLGSLEESPYKEFKDLLQREPAESNTKENPVVPSSRDAILLHCNDTSVDKLYEHQTGNKVVFNLASQFVTTTTTDSKSRVEAALLIIYNFEQAEIPLAPDEKPPASKNPRFLIRNASDEESWEPMAAAQAAEFAVSFVFEVALEKDIALLPPKAAAETAPQNDQVTSPSKDPVPEPTDHDGTFVFG